MRTELVTTLKRQATEILNQLEKAARRLVQEIFEHVDHLQSHPRLASKPPELKGWRYRQIVLIIKNVGLMSQ